MPHIPFALGRVTAVFFWQYYSLLFCNHISACSKCCRNTRPLFSVFFLFFFLNRISEQGSIHNFENITMHMCLNYMNNKDSKHLLTNTLSKVLSCNFSLSIQILCWKAAKIFISRKHLLLLFKKMNCLMKITILASRKKTPNANQTNKPKNTKTKKPQTNKNVNF